MKRLSKLFIVFALVFGLVIGNTTAPIHALEAENILLNKPTTGSSYEVEQFNFSKAVDGNKDKASRWGTDVNRTKGEWIEVDIGHDEFIETIVITFERETAEQNILAFKVEIAKDGVYRST